MVSLQYSYDLTEGDLSQVTVDDLRLFRLFPEVEMVAFHSVARKLPSEGLSHVAALPVLRILQLEHASLVTGDFLRSLPEGSPLSLLHLSDFDQLHGKELSEVGIASSSMNYGCQNALD